MKRHGPGRAIGWLATGATLVAAGAVLGAAAGRRRPSPARRAETDDDLADRPVARAALADAVAAAHRVDEIATSVARLETRVAAIENSTAARVDAVWQRVLQLEARLEQLKAERAAGPSLEQGALEQAAAEVERRLAPRVEALGARVEENQTAIRQLETHAQQTEANLQKMIAAVEKLADQVARVLPAGPVRREPQRETGVAAPETPAPSGETRSEGERRASSFQWRSVALLAAITAGLVASYATGPGARRPAVSPPPAVVAAPAPDRWLEDAVGSLTVLAARQPANTAWKYELARLHEMRGDVAQAEWWYRAVLATDPQDYRARDGLAELLANARGASAVP
jgi:hypothetical protein